MKNIKFLLITSILFVGFNLFSYQMQEKYLVSAGLNTVPHEQDILGQKSNVFLIKDLRQFSVRVVNNSKPVVVKIISNKSSNNDMKLIYQSLADQIGDVVFFATINTDFSHQLKLLLQKILGFDESQLPLIVFFKNGQMILPAFSGTVTKENLFKLIKTRFGKKLVKVDKQTLKNINSNQILIDKTKKETRSTDDRIIIKDKSFRLKEEAPKDLREPSVWEKIKGFFQN